MAKKKAKPRKSLNLDLPIYQLKVKLEDIDPPIWRRVQIDDRSLDELHAVLQVVMGWDDMHMYAFNVDDHEYGNPECGGDFEYDSRFVRLSDILAKGHTRFRYAYDFGDDWRHLITVEKTLPAEAGVRYPRCLEGERACPPEDSGGPYGYPDFLETLQDPECEEHEELAAWAGDFDPEKFDLDSVNDDLRGLRRWLGRRRGKRASAAAFAKDSLVQVKAGVVHDQYPDIPLGGWVGKVKRIGWLTPVGYAVHWTKPTLDRAHPVYFKRCERDGLKPHRHWLEEDQLEAAADETPAAMEQPTKLVAQPLSADDPDDRVRMVFGLTRDDPLPEADEQLQRRFLDHLKARLSFPFKAVYPPASALGGSKSPMITVLGFADPPLDRKGVMCDARKGKHRLSVPLYGIMLSEEDATLQLVEDYAHWLRSAKRCEEGEKETDADAQFPMGTLALYGPDDKTTTKIVAGVFQHEGAEPILQRWVASDVVTSEKVRKEIDKFFKKHGVKRVGMADENLGCPHEEGSDFPVGGDCPFCPWWKGKQGSRAKDS